MNCLSFLKDHFSVQKGMYFTEIQSFGNWTVFTSDIIEDGFWNYAYYNGRGKLDITDDLARYFDEKKRPVSIYTTDNQSEYSKNLEKRGFELISEESFMLFDGCTSVERKIKAIPCDKEHMAQFLDVFGSAYGGEKTPEQPYGELSQTYMDSLRRSFSNKSQFRHLICYQEENPAAIATLCYKDGKGGLYNVGTEPMYRSKGFGTDVTLGCILEWKGLGGQSLFLQTETGSTVESWYKRLGFRTIFIGRIYSKA